MTGKGEPKGVKGKRESITPDRLPLGPPTERWSRLQLERAEADRQQRQARRSAILNDEVAAQAGDRGLPQTADWLSVRPPPLEPAPPAAKGTSKGMPSGKSAIHAPERAQQQVCSGWGSWEGSSWGWGWSTWWSHDQWSQSDWNQPSGSQWQADDDDELTADEIRMFKKLRALMRAEEQQQHGKGGSSSSSGHGPRST